jgi:hypothetical protein
MGVMFDYSAWPFRSADPWSLKVDSAMAMTKDSGICDSNALIENADILIYFEGIESSNYNWARKNVQMEATGLDGKGVE